jgi:Ca2+-binding RTX toxin-like protein
MKMILLVAGMAVVGGLSAPPIVRAQTEGPTATFQTDVLSVVGTSGADDIVVAAADVFGNLIVTNGGVEVPIVVNTGEADKFRLRVVMVDGGPGNDRIRLDESLNIIDHISQFLSRAPNAVLRGGRGNDTLIADTGGSTAFPGPDTPVVGNVVLDGEEGSDTILSGFGNDVLLGGPGEDTLVWRPGTLNDFFDGGDGTDRAEVSGNDTPISSNADHFELDRDRITGGLILQRTNLIPFFVRMVRTEAVSLRTQSGDDSVVVNDIADTGLVTLTLDGGEGDDALDGRAQMDPAIRLFLLGGPGNDVLFGGAGADRLDGGSGLDRLFALGGQDLILARDGGPDTLDCGAGDDRAVVDSDPPDSVVIDCEKVARP